MIKERLKPKTFAYKLYLYYQLYFRYGLFYKKKNFSQFNEDIFIEKYFENIRKGSFVDLGAFHPIKFNNTYLLYKKGWSGINVDLNQTSIDMFNILRKRDKNICALISNKKNKKKKIFFEHNFSAVSTINPTNHDKKILNRTKIMKTKSFSSLIKKRFDFLNIDLEGHDYEVLKTINLKKYQPSLICIEILHYKNKKNIFCYMKKNNYNFKVKKKISYFFERQK